MEVSGESEHFQPLQPGAFRLLQLERRFDEQIACHLTVHLLASCPDYVALSYAWNDSQGDPIDSYPITVNGRASRVTPNLWHALRHLVARQEEYNVEYFWIDALCINQSSDSERTIQVSLMHQIYRTAVEVCVWLGPDLNQEVYAVREFLRALLQQFYDEGDCMNGTFGAKKYAINFLHTDDEHALYRAKLPQLDAPIWHQVLKFWDRSWFSRVWVQQEVGLARKVSFWCGELEFTQEELVESSRFNVVSGLGSTLMVLRIGASGRRNTIEGRKIGCSALRINNLQAWVTGKNLDEADDTKMSADRMTGPKPAITRPHQRPHLNTRFASSLLRLFAMELFLTFRDDCTDPRDRIFALLVLMKQVAEAHDLAPLPLQVDYSKTVATVFTVTTAWVIENTGWLGIFCLIWLRRDLNVVVDLPSWVPDFTSPPASPMHMFKPEFEDLIKQHAAYITPETKPSVQGPHLFVSVKRLGTIQDIGDSYDTMLELGLFEENSKLLLNLPDEVFPNYTRIDYWTDVMECKMRPSTRTDNTARRAGLLHWLTFVILRKIGQDIRGGRITRGREHLAKMPSLESLGLADVSKTLPTWKDWSTTYSTAEKQYEILNHRPTIQFTELGSRRLFRLVDLGFECCPSATLLGLGPDGIAIGDEVFEVVGSVMPLVLRRTAEGKCEARVVGEGFITGFDQVVKGMEGMEYERWKLA